MATVAKDLRSTIKLPNGDQMPMFGLGMALRGDLANVERITATALRAGYRLVDTATFYGNQEGVGAGIRSSGVPREDIFVVTKVWEHGREACIREVTASLQKLGSSYIDLHLVHHPLDGQILDTYDTLLEYQAQGVVRSVGVSNFNIHHLEALLSAGRPLPAVNQVELHAFNHKRALVDYCRGKGIAVMGYAPLARTKKMSDPLLNSLAQKYNKSPAQVMLRYSVQSGYITIPKTSKPHRVQENADIFNFAFTPEEMEALDSTPEFYCCHWGDPTSVPWYG